MEAERRARLAVQQRVQRAGGAAAGTVGSGRQEHRAAGIEARRERVEAEQRRGARRGGEYGPGRQQRPGRGRCGGGHGAPSPAPALPICTARTVKTV